MLFTELLLKKSKHIPYSNKLPSQFVTNTPYVSPLKICRTVVRQILYYGVRVPTTLKIIKTRNILKNIPRFWYAGRDFVETHSVFKQFCRAKS